MNIKHISGFMLSVVLMASALFGRTGVEIETYPARILKNSNSLPVEIIVNNFSGVPVSEVAVHYRYSGDGSYKSYLLNNEGFRYYASLNLDEKSGAMVEYYYSIRYADEGRETYPNDAASGNVLRTAVQYQRNYGNEILVISPDDNEQLNSNEIVISASFTRLLQMIDSEKTRIYLDNIDITKYVAKYDEFITFAPKKMPVGKHKIRLELFDNSNTLIASKEWQFTALQTRAFSRSSETTFLKGSLFAESRGENLRDGDISETYNQGGLRLRGGLGSLTYGGRLYFNNQEASNRQPVNRYYGHARMNFWNNRYLYLAVGDAYPRFNPMLLQNVLVRGFRGEFHLKFMNIDVASGSTLRRIEGEGTTTTAGGQETKNITRAGTFERKLFAVRPSFGDGKKFQLGFTYLKGRDDTSSINYGRNPEENVALGSDLYIGLDKQRFIVMGNINVSAYNRNITGGSIPYDSLVTILDDSSDIERNLYDRISDIITVNQYLVLKPGLAYQGQIRLRYLRNNLNFIYESVEEDFYSLGQPYLLRDNRGFHIVDNINLVNNQVFLTVGYRNYQNNLNDLKENTTKSTNLYANLSYYPRANLPELTLGYNSYSRNNDVSEDVLLDSTATLLNRPEDNQTNSLNFATGYRFKILNSSSRLGASLMNYRRNDIYDFAESNSDFLNINLRTDYGNPFQTQVEFILQKTETGKDSDRESTLDMTTIGLGASYSFKNILARDMLSVRGKVRFGNINTLSNLYSQGTLINESELDYKRNYISLRINYTVARMGTISLLANWLTYSGDREYKDFIYSARYDVSF